MDPFLPLWGSVLSDEFLINSISDGDNLKSMHSSKLSITRSLTAPFFSIKHVK
jgi:hypothetical protein